jgi:hypothetical protein
MLKEAESVPPVMEYVSESPESASAAVATYASEVFSRTAALAPDVNSGTLLAGGGGGGGGDASVPPPPPPQDATTKTEKIVSVSLI